MITGRRALKEEEIYQDALLGLSIVNHVMEPMESNGHSADKFFKPGQYYTVRNNIGGKIGRIVFQAGSPEEWGANGVTNEALIATLVHRLRILDSSIPSEKNKEAIAYLTKAHDALEERIQERLQRGVYDTDKP